MIEVTFQRSDGEERVIARCKPDDVLRVITKFCENRHFKIYYTRTWQEDDRTKYDVGSHTEFFYSKEVADDE